MTTVMKKEMNNWLASAEYDLETARQMLKTARYVYVIFMCHLAIEKALKAHVCLVTGKAPPRTHDLVLLVKMARLVPDAKDLDFIGEIGNTSVATRYPEDMKKLLKGYDKRIAERYFRKSREIVAWLCGKIS